VGLCFWSFFDFFFAFRLGLKKKKKITGVGKLLESGVPRPGLILHPACPNSIDKNNIKIPRPISLNRRERHRSLLLLSTGRKKKERLKKLKGPKKKQKK
jgi:hypothetical protein